MDVWNRRIVGWQIAEWESADIAAALIARTCSEGNVDSCSLVLHSDNGKAMRGSTMISTLQWLGVIPSFSRPHVSDDNPYSEALFRTLKHTPAYPRLPLRRSGVGDPLGDSLRELVQRHAPAQRDQYVTPDPDPASPSDIPAQYLAKHLLKLLLWRGCARQARSPAVAAHARVRTSRPLTLVNKPVENRKDIDRLAAQYAWSGPYTGARMRAPAINAA